MLTKRIRSYPSLLAVFFHDKSFHRPHAADPAPAAASEGSAPAGLFARSSSPDPLQAVTAVSSDPGLPAKKELEFLLFSYLLRFVHRESPIGEFARAGIMFLIDVAFSPGEDRGEPDPLADTKLLLGEFMLDNDFADVLGAALGAAYSTLPSKLLVQTAGSDEIATSGGMTLCVGNRAAPAGKDENEDAFLAVAEPSTSDEFRTTLGIFLGFLEFLQDVIKRGTSSSPSPAVDTPDASMSLTPQTLIGASLARAILSAVQTTFLDHVLYPNILECSDQDGSVVAVLSYIDIILSTLKRDGPLARVILDFLVGKDEGGSPPPPVIPDRFVPAPASPDGEEDHFTPPPSVSKKSAKHRRRKSSAMILLENINHIPRSSLYPSQGRFTLRDLVLDNVGSPYPRTATAALKLVQTILTEYPHVGLPNLFATAVGSQVPAINLLPTLLSPSVDDGDWSATSFARPRTPDSIRPILTTMPPSDQGSLPLTPPSLPEWMQADLPIAETSPSTPEAKLYLGLVREMLPRSAEQPDISGYIRDATATFEANPALTAFQLGLLSATENGDALPIASMLKLNPSDKLLQRTHDRLREFFIHTPEENLALTGVLASIAIRPEISLQDWLTLSQDDEGQIGRPKSAPRTTVVDRAHDNGDDDSFFHSVALAKPRKLLDNDPFRESDQSEMQPVLLTLFANLVRSRASLAALRRS